MDVTRPQLGPQTVAVAGKGKKRMEAVLGKMAIVGHSLLLAVGRVLGGIQINDEPPLVLPFQQGAGALVRAPSKAANPWSYPGRRSPTGKAWTDLPLSYGLYQLPV
jgi:hypothetical protein